MKRNSLLFLSAIGVIYLPAIHAEEAPVAADTYLSGRTVGAGSSPVLPVGRNSYALIQFDLSALQSLHLTSSDIQKATLTFFVDSVTTPGTLNVALVEQPWTESGTTFNNFNLSLVAQPFATGVPVTTWNEYVYVEMTQQVQQWLTGGVPNYGIMISAP